MQEEGAQILFSLSQTDSMNALVLSQIMAANMTDQNAFWGRDPEVFTPPVETTVRQSR